ncbi:MAG TPA: zf-HC2 domain-containing protein [bacterium]|nr:zf-HC2 domain-containing protein [bacterium]
MTNENCERVKGLLGDLLSRDLTSDERRMIEEHAASCAACATSYRALLAARSLLREHRPVDDAPPEELRAALHRRLVEERSVPEEERASFLGWPVRTLLGAVACLFLFLLGYWTVTSFPRQTEDAPVAISRSVVNAKEPLTIRLTYTAERPITEVFVKIRLDEDIVFHTEDLSFRELREYEWKGDLKAGRNEIPFVVEMRRAGTRTIHTTAEFEGYRHRHDVELHADGETMTVTYLAYGRVPL